MSVFPLCPELNAIWLPSGEKELSASNPGSVVILVAKPPAAGITQMSAIPPRDDVKAI
jgi:hypothetical protein